MERRLAAIVIADVVGYSKLIRADEVGTRARFRELQSRLFGPSVTTHGGRVIKTMGDSFLLEFPSAVEAVACSAEVQRELQALEADRPEDQRILFRIGINVGDIIVEGDDIHGDGVNIAARLEELSEPGGILISGNVHEQVQNRLDDVGFAFAGDLEVKNIPKPVPAYRVLLDPADAGKQADTASATAGRRPILIVAAPIAAVLLIAVVGGSVWWWQQPNIEPAEPAKMAQTMPDKPSIAVLPFKNLSDAKDQEYFADGMTDDLITDLSKISGLKVIARNTIFTYEDRAMNVCHVAKALSVRYMLEGSVRRSGNRLRINAQLIDCPTGGHVWADRYDREVSDVFALQDEVIRHIVDTLSVQLSTSEQRRLERLPTINLEAYDYYLRGEQAARTGSRPMFRVALQFHIKAITLDPKFAQAFAAMARVEATVMRLNYDDVLTWPVARKRAYEHAGRALEIDQELSLPFSVLSELQLVDHQHAEALKSAERAVTVAPGDPSAHAALGLVLTFNGRHSEAVAAIETARRLDPNLPTVTRQFAGLAYILNGQPRKAVEILERARDAAPNEEETYGRLVAAYALAGKIDAARDAAATVERIGPNLSMELFRVKLAHFRNPEDLNKIITAMTEGGLQKWPFAFRPGNRASLTGPDIKKVTFGRTWRGRLDGVGPAIMQIGSDGKLGFRTTTYIATGTAHVENDMLCEHIDALTLGRTICGPIYRSDSEAGGQSAYTYVNASKVFRFSPDE